MTGDRPRLFRVSLHGRGAAMVAAHGSTDAEHRLERIAGTAWSDLALRVVGMRREDGGERLVTDFRLTYELRVHLEVAAPSGREAVRLGRRAARERLAGTPLAAVEWVRSQVDPAPVRE